MCLLCCKHSLYRKGSSESSVSYWSRRVLARKKITPDATRRNPATEAMAIPTTSGSDTYSSQCSPRYHQFSPTRHLKQVTRGLVNFIFGRTVPLRVVFTAHTCRWLPCQVWCHISHHSGRSLAVCHRYSDMAGRPR